MLITCPQTQAYFAPLDVGFNKNDRVHIEYDHAKQKFDIDVYNLIEMNDGLRRFGAMVTEAFFKRLPEAKKLKSTYAIDLHGVPVTDIACELISHHVPAANLTFGDELAKQVFHTTLIRSRMQDAIAEQLAAYKLCKRVPDHNYELCAELPLKPYQQAALCASMASMGFGLFADMGTGKTPITIAHICNAAIQHRERALELRRLETEQQAMGWTGTLTPIVPYKAILVMPPALRMNWVGEFERFATRPGRVQVIRGTQLGRAKQLIDAVTVPEDVGDCYYTVVIIGYQTLRTSWEFFGRVPWDLAVIDEAQNIVNAKAKQSQMCLQLRDNSKQRLVLTGTPYSNNIVDLYMILEFMGKGYSGFSSLKEFRRFFTSFKMVYGNAVTTGVFNIPFLQERLARYSFTITKAEALPDLPCKVHSILEVQMTDRQAQFYKKLARELAIEIERIQESDMERQMQITCILTKLLRLSQITSGFVTWDSIIDPMDGHVIQESHSEWCDVENPKVQAIMEVLVQHPPNEKFIVWANWTADVDYLMYAAEQVGLKVVRYDGQVPMDQRRENELAFNGDRSVRGLMGTAATGGAGLNLIGYPPERPDEYDTDCTLMLYMSQGWSRVKRKQSGDRANRFGSRKPLDIRTVIVPGTIDEQIYRAVQKKEDDATTLADLSMIMSQIMKLEI